MWLRRIVFWGLAALVSAGCVSGQSPNGTINGLVLDPTPEALAEGMERLWADKNGTRAKGRAARDTLRQKNITWDQVLERLVA